MLDLEEVKRFCVETFLVPMEGVGPMTSDGKFIAYPDPGNKATGLPITIAWGITFDELGNPIQLGDTWDEERALRVKQLILNKFLAALLAMSPNLLEATEKQVAAILSFCYNCGLGNYRISTFRKKIQEEEWEDAQHECRKWNKAQGKVMRGLDIRRLLESKYLLP